jgi:hypothetical protein
MDPCTDPRNRQTWRHMPRKAKPTPYRWAPWLAAALAFLGLAIFTADRALPSIAATAIEAGAQSELYMEGY